VKLFAVVWLSVLKSVRLRVEFWLDRWVRVDGPRQQDGTRMAEDWRWFGFGSV